MNREARAKDKTYEGRYDERLKGGVEEEPRYVSGSPNRGLIFFVFYESIKRELKIKSIYECRCDERLQTKTREVTRLGYTGLVVELEHLKI
jgi:hypothetical protein